MKSRVRPSGAPWNGISGITESWGGDGGGMIGFRFAETNQFGVDGVTVKSWNGSAWVTEHVEDFSSAYDPVYDKSGNITFDGSQSYTYDAWNRLLTVKHAYKNGATVASGQMLATMSYDGLGRRIACTPAP